jgi:hypothetical protein
LIGLKHSFASDVWSFGLLARFLAVGHFPLPIQDPPSVLGFKSSVVDNDISPLPIFPLGKCGMFVCSCRGMRRVPVRCAPSAPCTLVSCVLKRTTCDNGVARMPSGNRTVKEGGNIGVADGLWACITACGPLSSCASSTLQGLNPEHLNPEHLNPVPCNVSPKPNTLYPTNTHTLRVSW